MEYIILSIALLFLCAILNLFINENWKLKVSTFFVFVSSLFALVPSLKVLIFGTTLTPLMFNSPLFGTITFSMDVLSALFILIISILSSLAVLYSNEYLEPYLFKNKNITSHCFFLMLLIAAMYGVVIARNGLFFLVIWEIMSLSSFFLVLFEGEKKETRKAGIKYLIYMHLSVIFLMTMFAILTNATSSFDFTNYADALIKNSQLANLVFILGFIGFGIKAGFVPFHNWLPEAHPAAPSHVSGMMSAVMIKTGIYGILRILSMIGIPSKTLSYLVLVIAVITILYGVLYAITQHDIKKLLAYSSIENIGIIGLGIGVGMLGLTYNNTLVSVLGFCGALLHVLNHSLFKGLMFLTAGSVYLKTHTRNIEFLGGLIKKMPYTGLMFILGSVAISGLPPFNGFISEILIYAGMLLGIPASEISLFIVLIISIAALALAGTMAMLCFSKATGITFLGEPRTEIATNVTSDVGIAMLLPMGILAFLSLMIGLFPQYFINLVLMPTMMFIDINMMDNMFYSVVSLTQHLSWCFFIFLLILLSAVILRLIINRKSKEYVTWGCGYDRPNAHMQYTPSSFDNLFVSTLKPLFKRISHIKKPKDLFPNDAYFELEIEDIEEAYIVEPIIKMDEKILSKFERIQNGNMQQYILFGLIFLVIAIIGLIVFGG
jgi:formate hydrogenlyase subunit 3/multisubunit Na+/H+ antiporter MnhD subunit